MNVNTRPCRRHREAISLLAAGVLPETEHAGLASHLTTCAGCQQYYRDMQTLAADFAEVVECERQVEPAPAMRARWAREIRSLEPTNAFRWHRLPWSLVAWWQHLRATNRAAAIGLAAVWALVLFFNLSAPDIPQVASTAMPVSPRELILALKAERWSASADAAAPAPVESPTKTMPRPRSERRANTRTG
jgi:hypothetical protein